MRITSSNVNLSSMHSFQAQQQQSSSMKVWSGKRPELPQPEEVKPEEVKNEASVAPADKAEEIIPISEEDKIKIKLVEKMVFILTGKKIKITVPRISKEKAHELKNAQNLNSHPPQGQGLKGWGLEFDYHEEYFEHEATDFSASGIIKTADGKEINFSVDLRMARTFWQSQHISIREGDAQKVDPLVINFGSGPAKLTTAKYAFDLDSDGRDEQISFLEAGSGFLLLDRNGDGIANNGSELFGPKTGNGFAELAAFDDDNNNWIDENDSIYNKLRIWQKDSEGNDFLLALGEAGIGAIYLGHIQSEFAVKTAANESLGQIRTSGIYLKESGTAGTIQQIDLTI